MCHTQGVPVAIRTIPARAETPGNLSELIANYALGCGGGRAAEF